MSSTLTPISYTVLGLVAKYGAATPYDLKREVNKAIGHFWSFPHSQLYAEPRRLVELGLLREEREQSGRRRRTYRITKRGRAALEAWVRAPADEATQIRDLGLLKLFFSDMLERDQVVELARRQERVHRERLAHYDEVERMLAGRGGEASSAYTVLRMGLLCERAFVRFWASVAARPPEAATERAESVPRAG